MADILCHPCAVAIANADSSGLSAEQDAALTAWSESVGHIVVEVDTDHQGAWFDCAGCGGADTEGHTVSPIQAAR